MDEIAAKVAQVPGVVGVMLGGSRARGTHRPDSDWDLGVYYRGEPDLAALEALAVEVTGGPVEVYGPGAWGAWVNGGAWLVLPDGSHVDWILRDVDRVRRVWQECREGRFEIGAQAGHPLGFWSPAYPGEAALGRVLADTDGELARLRNETRDLSRGPAQGADRGCGLGRGVLGGDGGQVVRGPGRAACGPVSVPGRRRPRPGAARPSPRLVSQ